MTFQAICIILAFHVSVKHAVFRFFSEINIWWEFQLSEFIDATREFFIWQYYFMLMLFFIRKKELSSHWNP